MRLAAVSLAVLGCLAIDRSALAATAAAPATDGQIVGSIERSDAIDAERRRTADELASISARVTLTRDGIARLDREIEALAADRNRIRQAMIDAAAAQKAIARDVAATEARIGALAGDEAGLKASLRSRRGLLAEVLAALERMGRKPPPALLVKPDDALGSVRSAILLGAVVPGIRAETLKLAGDLQQLAGVRRDIAAEKERYVAKLTGQREEEARLRRLFTEKERLEADSLDRRRAERARAAALAAQATSLQELVASLAADAEKARAAEASARQLAEAQKAQAERLAADNRAAALARAEREAPRPPDERGSPPDSGDTDVASLPSSGPPPTVAAPAPDEPAYDIASLRREMTPLEPAAAFSTMKGRLTVPVSGNASVRFGGNDGIGRPSAGMRFAARAGDVVTAPADAQVLYAGPFRSYGDLLILDAGDGYHMVLAGMSRADVEVGQFVLAGEPVAVMGSKRVANASDAGFEAAEPSLYVEFRKDGKPVDPMPWWAGRPSGRTGNDT